MNISILIKHYKYNDLTIDCLNSLFRSDLCGADVIVIDSTEDSDFKYYGSYTYHQINNSIGLIESFNQFIDGRSDLYLCLNNDIYVHKNWLNSIVRCLESDKKIGIIAPLYDQPGGGILEYPKPPFEVGTTDWDIYLTNSLRGNFGRYAEAQHVDNCAWGFTQELINSIGLPDGTAPGAGWYANQDYSYRAKMAGYKTVASLGSFIHHAHRGTYNRLDSGYATKAQQEGFEWVSNKYGGKIPW